MNEGKAAMTYDAFMDRRIDYRAIRGVPGIAVRLGRALERWGRSQSQRGAARPVDREALRREFERRSGIEARMRESERLLLGRR